MKTIVTILFILAFSIGAYAQKANITPQNKLQEDIKN